MDKYTDIVVPITVHKFDDNHLYHHFTNREKFSVTDQCDQKDWIFNYQYEVYALDVKSTIPTDTQYAIYGFQPISCNPSGPHEVNVDISSLFTSHYDRETNTVEIIAKNTQQMNFWLKHYNLKFQIHFNVPTKTILNRNKA